MFSPKYTTVLRKHSAAGRVVRATQRILKFMIAVNRQTFIPCTCNVLSHTMGNGWGLEIAEGAPEAPSRIDHHATSLSFLCVTPPLSTINGSDIFQDMDVLSFMPAAGKEERQQIDRSSTLWEQNWIVIHEARRGWSIAASSGLSKLTGTLLGLDQSSKSWQCSRAEQLDGWHFSIVNLKRFVLKTCRLHR